MIVRCMESSSTSKTMYSSISFLKKGCLYVQFPFETGFIERSICNANVGCCKLPSNSLKTAYLISLHSSSQMSEMLLVDLAFLVYPYLGRLSLSHYFPDNLKYSIISVNKENVLSQCVS